MKKILLTLLLLVASISAINAQNSARVRKVLDKTAAIVGRRGGASADFKISNAKLGTVSGSIAIKGRMFHARTPKAIVWYNGKTQWSYMQQTNEVNVTTPTEAQRMRMNPYTFITMYKNGYNMSMTQKGGNYEVHLTAQNQQRTVKELYLTINSKTYTPSRVRMREGSGWTNITISNFKAQNYSNSTFTFRAKDYPKAEVIDLR